MEWAFLDSNHLSLLISALSKCSGLELVNLNENEVLSLHVPEQSLPTVTTFTVGGMNLISM